MYVWTRVLRAVCLKKMRRMWNLGVWLDCNGSDWEDLITGVTVQSKCNPISKQNKTHFNGRYKGSHIDNCDIYIQYLCILIITIMQFFEICLHMCWCVWGSDWELWQSDKTSLKKSGACLPCKSSLKHTTKSNKGNGQWVERQETRGGLKLLIFFRQALRHTHWICDTHTFLKFSLCFCVSMRWGVLYIYNRAILVV